jgi:CSLREA domain-containing protein
LNTWVKRAAVLAVLLATAWGARSATFVVTTTEDGLDAVPGDGICASATLPGMPCTLRAAIAEANASGGDDVVVLAPATYVLRLAGDGEQFGHTGDLDVFDHLTIEGHGATLVGDGSDRLFEVHRSRLALVDITLTGGRVDGEGGAVFGDNATLVMAGVELVDNASTSDGGGIYAAGGVVELHDVVIARNAGLNGGGVALEETSADLRKVRFEDNSAIQAGGFYAGHLLGLSLDEVEFVRNVASVLGGGMVIEGASLARSSEVFGADDISDTMFKLMDTAFSDNVAHGGVGGGLFVDHLFTAIDEVGLVVFGCRFAGNRAIGGGGLWNDAGSRVEIRHSRFEDNLAVGIAGVGGGVYAREPLAIVDVLFRDNFATESGGGLYGESRMDLRAATFVDNLVATGGIGAELYLNADISDADGDATADASDNCLNLFNVDQADLDSDGRGDACDGDIDGDGLDNLRETEIGTDPWRRDSDNDGRSDGDEIATGSNPLLNEAAAIVPLLQWLLDDGG